MKKLTALFLVLTMVLSVMTVFTACDNSGNTGSTQKEDPKKDEATIVGTWTGSFDLEEGIEIPEDMEGYLEIDSLEVEVTLEFKKNGDFKLTYENFDEMYEVLADAFKNAFLIAIEEEGMTVTEFEAQIGMSLDDYIEQIFETELNANKDAEYEYELDGDTLTLTKTSEEETVELEFEIQLKEDSLKFKEYTGKSKHEDTAKQFLAMGKLERED